MPEWFVVEKCSSTSGLEEKHVARWNFRLGGKDFTCNPTDLRGAFGMPDRSRYPHVPNSTKDEFWKMITRADEDYRPSQKATNIEEPIWKLIHGFISTCIYLRKDGGRWVNSADLDLMCCMHEGKRFDPLIVITKALNEHNSPSFRGTYLGGGHFVTIIARHVGFLLDPSREMPRRVIREKEMIHRGFIKNVRMELGVGSFLVGRDPLPGELLPPSSPSRDQAGPSSIPRASNDYVEVLFKLDALTKFTYDGLRWQGDMFKNLYTRLGFDGYVSPPQHPFSSSNIGGVGTNAGEEGIGRKNEDNHDTEDL